MSTALNTEYILLKTVSVYVKMNYLRYNERKRTLKPGWPTREWEIIKDSRFTLIRHMCKPKYTKRCIET